MNWWSKNKRILFLTLATLLFAVVAIAISKLIFYPEKIIVTCTLIGCGGGIEVELVDLPANTPYQVILSFASGETKALSCDPDLEDKPSSFEKSCFSNGAFFSLEQDALPPDEVTVTIIVGGDRVSQVFNPVYKKTQPNGEDCPPICYSATVKINISQ